MEVIRPLLDVMGRLTMHVGPPGTGNRIKLLHNALGAVNAVAVAESLALCDAVGVDPGTYYEVVKNGGGMAYSTYFDRRVMRVVAGNYDPTFTLELMLKDVTLATEMAGELLATAADPARDAGGLRGRQAPRVRRGGFLRGHPRHRGPGRPPSVRAVAGGSARSDRRRLDDDHTADSDPRPPSRGVPRFVRPPPPRLARRRSCAGRRSDRARSADAGGAGRSRHAGTGAPARPVPSPPPRPRGLGAARDREAARASSRSGPSTSGSARPTVWCGPT